MTQQIVNGVWQTDPIRDDGARHVANPTDLDALVSTLSAIVVASQGLSEEDQRRMRNFVLAAGDLLMSRTRLEPTDRTIFERTLREAVKQRGRNDVS